LFSCTQRAYLSAMKQKQLTGFILSLSLLSMVLILALQTYWIKVAYMRAQDEFDQQVHTALRQVKQKIEARLEPLMVLNGTDSQTKVIYHLANDSFQYKFTYTDVSNPVYANHADTSNRISAIKQLALQLAHMHQDSSDKSEKNYFLIYLHSEKDYDALSGKIESIPIDSILAAALDQNGIAAPFDFGVYNAKKKDWYFKKQKLSTDTLLLKSRYRTSIFDNREQDIKSSSTPQLLVYFPDNSTYLYSKLIFVLLLTIVILLILGFVIWFLLRIVLEQKKLSDLKNDFINNMTHELKTPIATIKFAIANIENNNVIHSPEKIREITKIIQEESDHMNTHVEMVLKAAQANRKELEMKNENIDLHLLLNSLIDRFKGNLIHNKALINKQLQAKNHWLCGDVLHLTNVFSNLLDNAIKYSGDNIDISVMSSSDEKGLTVRISDKGIGMKKEHLDKIFDPFYRAATGNIHTIKGFGLGLSYAREIVVQHGGTITVSSKIGSGSTFTVVLPFNASVA